MIIWRMHIFSRKRMVGKPSLHNDLLDNVLHKLVPAANIPLYITICDITSKFLYSPGLNVTDRMDEFPSMLPVISNSQAKYPQYYICFKRS